MSLRSETETHTLIVGYEDGPPRPRRRRGKFRLPGSKTSYNKREALAGYLFILPWIIGFLIFTAQVNAQWYPNVLGPYADQIDIEAVPFRDANGEPFAVASGTSFVIPVGAANPAAACAWMINLTSDEAWNAAGEARAVTLEENGGLNTGLFTGSPASDQEIRERFVVETGNPGFDQVIATFYEVADYGQSFGSSPAGQEIQNELNNAVTAALLGDKTPEEALADAQQAAMRAYDNATAG